MQDEYFIGVCKDYLNEIQIDYLNLFHSLRLEERNIFQGF